MMLKKFKKPTSPTLKKKNFKAFLFFLLFSVFIWILVQFSKDYNQVVSVHLDLYNVPKDKIVETEKEELQLQMEETGFRLALFSILKPKIKVDLESLPATEKNLVYVVENHLEELGRDLNINLRQLNFLQDSVNIPYVQKEIKKIAVNPKFNISYAPGYSSNEFIKTTPDSITISGRKSNLDTISAINTQELSLKEVKESVSGTLKIDTSKLEGVTFYEEEINYELKVEKFTEGKVEVPIEIINKPKQANISIFPQEIVVVFTVSLEDYDQVSKEDFKVVCDFAEIKEDQSFLIPKIIKQPKAISTSRMNINKVEFVIKK